MTGENSLGNRDESDVAQKPNDQIGQLASDEDVRLALSAAGAIQRLVAERNALRGQAVAQSRELTRLMRHITLIRDSYRTLTSEFVTQLQHMDSALSAVIQEPARPPDSPMRPKETGVASSN